MFCEGCEDEVNEDKGLRKSLNQRVCDHARRRRLPVKEYRARYNLGTDAVVAWYKAKIRGGVLDCGCLVSEMKHGSKDIEMHQTNPSEPYFPDSWKLVCTNDHRAACTTPIIRPASVAGNSGKSRELVDDQASCTSTKRKDDHARDRHRTHRADRARADRPHTRRRRRRGQRVRSITLTIGDIALAVIAVFVILAYFNGWG